MKSWIAAFLLLLSSGAAAGDNGGGNYPTPPDVNIVGFFPWVPWQNTQWVPAERSTGNPFTRAEYGTEPGSTSWVGSAVTNARPLTERDLYQTDVRVLSRGGGLNYPEMEQSTVTELRNTLVVENAGNRTIKAIEWEYAWIDTPSRGTAISDLLNRASWQKMRSKVTIRPGENMRLRGEDPPRPQKGHQTRAFFASGVRITRVIYTTGQEWRAP